MLTKTSTELSIYSYHQQICFIVQTKVIMKTAIIFAFLVGLCLAADPVEILSEEKELHPDGQYKYK